MGTKDLKLEAIQRRGRLHKPGFERTEPFRLGIITAAFGAVWTIGLASLSLQMFDPNQISGFILLRQACYAVTAVLVFLMVIRDRDRLLSVPLSMLIVLGWSALSLIWSPSFIASLTRLTLTGLDTWLIFTTVNYIGIRRSLNVVKWILTVFLIISLFSVFFIPNLATHVSYHGNWRGLLGDKNQAGAVAAVTALMWIFSESHRDRLRGAPFALIAVVFLWNTGSRTALAMAVISTLCGILIITYGKRLPDISPVTKRALWHLWISIAVISALALIYLTFAGDVLSIILPDPKALSGRGEIWRSMIPTFQQNPWGGTGYGGYWKEVSSDYGGGPLRDVKHGHNGFFDAALQTGLPGLLCALAATVFFPVRKICCLLTIDPDLAVVPATLFIFAIGSNFTESGLFEGDRIWWLILLLALALLQRSLDQQRIRRRPAPRSKSNQES